MTSESSTTPLTLIHDLETWLQTQEPRVATWVEQVDFRASVGEVCSVPGADGRIVAVLAGIQDRNDPYQYAALPQRLPPGTYHFADSLTQTQANAAALGWALGSYVYRRYGKSQIFAVLSWPEQAQVEHVQAIIDAIFLGRELITTPANDMGPAQLAQAAQTLAGKYGAEASLIVGDDLLTQNFPAVHAVGRAAGADAAPRLIDFSWGDASHPKVTLVGKGVCFDTGGLDIKGASGMLMMKKDMGGAATVLALAQMVMADRLPVRLRVIIPAVENSVAGNAMRPLDVLQTRKGLTVEVGNTDAEGRLILSDALALADAESPDLLIDFATLTGAARVALGTELPALYATDDDVAAAILTAGKEVY
ncbi:MAG: leucyl aminopeptidase family protein, partial [Nannocystaceae bacterium]